MSSPLAWIYTAPYKGIGGFQRYANSVIKYVGKICEIGVYDTIPHEEVATYISSPLTSTKVDTLVNFAHLTVHSRLTNEMNILHYPAQFYAFRVPKIGYSPPHTLPNADSFVMTIHDLAFKYSGGGPLEDTMRQIRRHKDDLDHIITVSEFSKRDIIDYLDIPEERVSVIHNCVDVEVFNPIQTQVDDKVLSRFDIENPFIFHLSNGSRRKKVMNLINSFYHADTKKSLVLAGGAARTERIRSQVADLDLEDRVTYITEIIPDEELAAIYRQADALVLPSSLEGFGYPIIEALACGTECLLADSTALREVGGDVCRYVTSDDVEALTSGIESLNSVNKDFYDGVSLVEEKYSPKTFAQNHIDVYQNLVE
ncbi:MAG: glycosyltransferase family 4 protein [Halobacteriaceae archaeon]